MIAVLLLTVFWLGAFCMLLFRCAVYALPVMVGLSTGYWASTSGAGIVGGVVIGLVVGGVVIGLVVGGVVIGLVVGGLAFGLGQAAIATSRSSLLRFLVVGVFAAPAALVGYGMMLEVWQLTMSPGIWQHAFGAVSGLVVAVATTVRLLDKNPWPTNEKDADIPTGL